MPKKKSEMMQRLRDEREGKVKEIRGINVSADNHDKIKTRVKDYAKFLDSINM